MQPRREVWEYGLLPLHALCPQLDTTATLLNFHRRLHATSTLRTDGKRTVHPQDVAAVIELTQTQLEVLTEVLAALSVSNSCAASSDQAPFGEELIFLHELSLFLLCHLFSKEAQRPDSMECWPGEANSGLTELMSPTRGHSKTGGSGRGILRAQLQAHLRTQWMAVRGFGDFLRRNLRLLLEIVADTPAPLPDSCLLSAPEVDRLNFVLTTSGPVSAYLPVARSPQPLDQLVSTIKVLWEEGDRERLGSSALESPRLAPLGSLSSPSPKCSRPMGMVSTQGQGQVDDHSVSAMVKATVARGESDLTRGEVRVSDCHDSIIYLLAPLQAAFVTCCSDCTIVIGAVGRLLRVEKCDKVTIIAATNRLLISSCHDCTFYIGVPRAPCLIGDNRFLRLAPFNTRYERHISHAAEVGLRADLPNRFDSPVILAGKDRRGQTSAPDSPRSFSLSTPHSASRAAFSLLPAEELLPFVVPFGGGPGPMAGGSAPSNTTKWSQVSQALSRGAMYLFPLPPDYERALQRKLGMTHDLRQRLKQGGLNKEKERELNDAIQAYFKEWLFTSGLLRQIYDLSALEKDELAMAAAAAAAADMRAGGAGGSSAAAGGSTM